jgi:hypothetical protein
VSLAGSLGESCLMLGSELLDGGGSSGPSQSTFFLLSDHLVDPTASLGLGGAKVGDAVEDRRSGGTDPFGASDRTSDRTGGVDRRSRGTDSF